MRVELASASVVFLLAAACGGERSYERCPEGQIATPNGCLPVPARRLDASAGRDARSEPDAAEPLDPDGGAPDADQPPQPDAGMPDPERLELSGAWAMELRSADTVTSRTLNATETVILTTLARVELAHGGDELAITTEICDVAATPFAGYTTTYPPTAIATLELHQGRGTISALEPGAGFRTEPRVQVMGWSAVIDPATEPVPESANDGRLIDADEDQNPGVTLFVSGPIDGELYVAARSIVSLDGVAADNDHISGGASTNRVQNTIGASNDLLGAGEITMSPDPDPSKNNFRMVRVPGMIPPTCEAIIQVRRELFP